MIVLGFDTSAGHCAAALYKDGEILVEQREEMKRGQAERLMVLLEEILTSQNMTWADLDAIGVGVGPGNFTGIRICVSAARGLALGLGIPAIGVNRFDIIQAQHQEDGLPCVPAPQNKVYIRRSGNAPEHLDQVEAEQIGQPLIFEPLKFNPTIAIAQIAADRFGTEQPRPAPLYIKAADAAPARDAPPKIIA